MTNATGKRPTTFAIVGGGPAGLVAARAFLRRGIEVEILERHSALGGIWNMEQPGSPMYRSCNFISSRDYGGFIGYPMPRSYPLYPRWDQIRDYVQSFARAYGLDHRARLGAEVVRAEPMGSPDEPVWRVELGSGDSRDYRGVVVASGAQWQGFVPDIPGLETFTGRAIHSSEYSETSEFSGKRVLVVGAGNSGVDIVVDAAFHGSTAYLSTRRGYWFLPKLMFGAAVPDVIAGHIDFGTGSRLHGLDAAGRAQAVFEAVGDLTAYGLPAPDHPFGASHPILNNQVLHCLAHGLLEHRPDVRSIDGPTVRFDDDSSVDVDVIVFATGYKAVVPWLPAGVLDYREGHPQAVLGTLVPNQRGLYLAGALHFAEHTFSIFDRLVQVAAADAESELTGNDREAMARMREEFRPDLSGGFPFLRTARNANQIHIPALEAAFQELAGYGVEVPRYLDASFYSNVG